MIQKCDTRAGIATAIETLSGFNCLANDRKQISENQSIELQTWMILGRWYLDEYGNLQKIVDEKIPKELWYDIPNVMTGEEFQKFSRERTGGTSYGYSVSRASLPSPSLVCPWCEKGWTIENCHDFDDRSSGMHAKCKEYHLHHNAVKQFTNIFSAAGIEVMEMRAIENQYWPKALLQHGAPWFLTKTKIGTITIGRRKRVIGIQWDMDCLNASEIFSAENVTKGKNYIHAWSEAEAIEYLTTLREEASKPHH